MLADPELDLLRELLEEDPGAPEFVDVGSELLRRNQGTSAVATLIAGLERDPSRDDGWKILFAAAGTGTVAFRRAREALERLRPDHATDDALAGLVPADAPTPKRRPATRRRSSPPVAVGPRRIISDPMLTQERAEAFVTIGRLDRAIRVYRRLAFHSPKDRALERRLRELQGGGSFEDLMEDDLSEELPSPALAPHLQMPMPRFGEVDLGERTAPDDGTGVNPATDVPVAGRSRAPEPPPGGRGEFVYGLLDDESEEEESPTMGFLDDAPDMPGRRTRR